MLFEINYWYEEKYFPTKRHRKLCSRNVYDSTSIEVKEVTSNDFPVAFIVRKFSSDQEEVMEERTEVRTYNEKLYKAVRYSDYVANTAGWLPLGYIKIYLESYVPFDVGGKNFSDKSIVMESNKADMLLYLQRQATEYLIFDNKVWQVCGEPLYCINTFGRKQGGTGFFVVFSYNENISKDNFFDALHRQEAIDYGRKIALDSGDTKSADGMGKSYLIDVLIPEMVSRKLVANHEDRNELEGVIVDSQDIANTAFSIVNNILEEI